MSLGKGQRQTADAALFRAIVEQFVARRFHPASDIDQFEKLATGFIDLLDADGAATCALELCLHPETPASVIARLLDKGGKAARIAFEVAPTIHRELLKATAEHGPVELAAAIARRSALDRRIVPILASRGESEVLCALAANRRAHLDQSARRALTQAGRDDLRLARILLDRDDLALDVEPLFLAATKQERAKIIVEASARALTSNVPETVSRPPYRIAEEIEASAIARDMERLADVLAEALDCRKSRIRAILADPGGEASALALLVLCVSEDTAIRIFLATDRGGAPDVERVRSLIALMRSTPPRAAQRLVTAITGSVRQERDAARRSASSDAPIAPLARQQPLEAGRARRASSKQPGAKIRV
jgi:uncharacterized protein (DUF2336 family)